jgi:hypothetical protein
MKNGKLLEITIHIVQEALKDKVDTQIFRNHKIKNNSGNKREFDIVIKARINGLKFTGVIECKDFNKPTSVEKIEAFNSKCQRIPQVHKKIFVSRNGYQKDAIAAAEDFGIEIYHIEELKNELINNWLSVKAVNMVKRYIQFDQIDFKTVPSIGSMEVGLHSKLSHESTKQTDSSKNFILQFVKQSNPGLERPFLVSSHTNLKNFDESHDLKLPKEALEGFYFQDNFGTKYYLTYLYCKFTFVHELVKTNVKVEKIASDEYEMSTVVTHESDEIEEVKLVLKENNPNTFDTFFLNKETEEFINSGYTFNFKKNSYKKINNNNKNDR